MRSDPPPAPRPGRNVIRLLLGLGTAAAAVGVGLIAVQQFRAREAQAEMLATPAPIDGARAYKYLKQICDLGPRVAGTEANTKQRQLVAAHFKKNGATLTEQPFTGNDPRSGAVVSMVNLVGAWHPDRRNRVVIGAHYDTRPFPDEERDPAKRKLPFLGANDGASGVALLMEIANHLEKLNTAWGVDLVIFDGEGIVYGAGQNQEGEYFLGAKEFARLYDNAVQNRSIRYRYAAGFVLDMIGDKELTIDQEENSMNLAPGLVREVWRVAAQLKVKGFRNRAGQAISDDHLPLNNAGIPTIDIIDFHYGGPDNPHWHTTGDVPENCSAASLEAVGRVVTGWLTQPRRTTR